MTATAPVHQHQDVPHIGVEELRALLEAHGAERGGGGLYRCPFHDEQHASLSVFQGNDGRGRYKCHGGTCGASGDALDLIQAKTGCTFREAVEQVTGGAGAARPVRPPTPTPRPAQKTAQIGAYRAIFQHIIDHAGLDPVARDYLENHGLSLEEGHRFGLRALPLGWDASQKFAGELRGRFDLDELQDAGVIGQKGGFRFRDRLLIPAHDPAGAVIWFQGRTLAGGEPKYLNVRGPRPQLYTPGGRIDVEALEDKRLWITEGALDALAAHMRHGLRAVAILSAGDGHLPELALRLAAAHRRGELEGMVLAVDNDKAGGGLRDKLIVALQGAKFPADRIERWKAPEGIKDFGQWAALPDTYQHAAREWERIRDGEPETRAAVECIQHYFQTARIEAVIQPEPTRT